MRREGRVRGSRGASGGCQEVRQVVVLGLDRFYRLQKAMGVVGRRQLPPSPLSLLNNFISGSTTLQADLSRTVTSK
jgi:hypothetical protein